jgi:O-acetyl-ADP-ribose deacetylase
MTSTSDHKVGTRAWKARTTTLPAAARQEGALMKITVVRGDITRQDVEAVVTAANAGLRGGGGVDGAVHRAAGPQLLQACRRLAPCPPGSAVITPAFGLAPVKWVIHAVGPVYGGPADAAVLMSAYTASLARADEVGARSIAFPAISTGVYGYPAASAAALSVEAVTTAPTEVEQVLLVAFSADMAQMWERCLHGG